MTDNKKNDYLITINYKFSLNEFEEYYRECVSYAEIEQISYIDFKTMFFEMINKNVKFRKYERVGKFLILKAGMSKKDFETFSELNKNNKFHFIHNFEISNIELFKEKELEK